MSLEHTARLLAILLDSGRSVINENQDIFDAPGSSGKGLAPDVFERQLTDMFRSRSGIDLHNLNAGHVPGQAKKLMEELVAVPLHVVADVQSERNPSGKPGRFIPAIFGDRVAALFTERTGVRMKQTTLVPRNVANAPDSTERSALEFFAVPVIPGKSRSARRPQRAGYFD